MTNYFNKLINFNDQQSAGRFAFLFSVMLSNIVLWYSWLFCCLWVRALVDIPDGVYISYGIANGVAFAGKGVQSFAERPPAVYSDRRRTYPKDPDE
jgi:hypothetical protein